MLRQTGTPKLAMIALLLALMAGGPGALTQQGYYRARPPFKATIDQLQYAREAPLTPHWPAIAKEITRGMEDVLVNNAPALQALTKAQERAQALVDA